MVERCIDLLLCYHGAGRRDGSRPFGGLVCRFHGAEGRADPVSEAMNCLKIRWVERFHSVNYCPPSGATIGWVNSPSAMNGPYRSPANRYSLPLTRFTFANGPLGPEGTNVNL